MQRASILFLLSLAFAAGCATLDVSQAPHIRPGEPGASMAEKMGQFKAHGVITEFNAGDTVDLHVELLGDLAETSGKDCQTLTLKQKLWVYTGPQGIWMSSDGKAYKPFKKFLHGGSVQVGLGFTKEKPRGVVSVVVQHHKR